MGMKYARDGKLEMTMRIKLHVHEKIENKWVMKERYNG